ncbi:hypothetical protein K466DRAFT_569331 [Polyporus arcularius HHB13444]|uniref:Uncharacterized protein n=1 Tax=Polyporus arcularius HHB13444 TaxID=1314778 RepID=A0A5C3NW11_9APHY|nr:hypothetical protein K466DRAFT_569331 [Polyporus arcularius HHB13444]
MIGFDPFLDRAHGHLPIPSSPIHTGPIIPTSPIGAAAILPGPMPTSPLAMMDDTLHRLDQLTNVPTSPIGMLVDLPVPPLGPAEMAVPQFPAPASFPSGHVGQTMLAVGDACHNAPTVPILSIRTTESASGGGNNTARILDPTARPQTRSARRQAQSTGVPASAMHRPASIVTRCSGAIIVPGESSLPSGSALKESDSSLSGSHGDTGTQAGIPAPEARDVHMHRSSLAVCRSPSPPDYDESLIRMAADVNQFGAERLAYLRGERRAWKEVGIAARKMQEVASLKDIGRWAMYNEFLEELGEKWYPD